MIGQKCRPEKKIGPCCNLNLKKWKGNGVWRGKEKLNREEWGGRATWWCTT